MGPELATHTPVAAGSSELLGSCLADDGTLAASSGFNVSIAIAIADVQNLHFSGHGIGIGVVQSRAVQSHSVVLIKKFTKGPETVGFAGTIWLVSKTVV